MFAIKNKDCLVFFDDEQTISMIMYNFNKRLNKNNHI